MTSTTPPTCNSNHSHNSKISSPVPALPILITAQSDLVRLTDSTKMRSILSLLVIGVLVLATEARLPVDAAQKDVLNSISTLWTQVERASQRSVINSLKQILERIELVEKPAVSNEIDNLNSWVQIQRKAGVIDTQYENLRTFLNKLNAPVSSDRGWLDLSESILQYQSELEALHKIAVNVYKDAMQARQAAEQSCANGQSSQTLLTNLYNSVQLSLLKSYAMTQAAWLLFTSHNRGFYRSNNVQLHNLFKKFIKEQATAAYTASEKATDTVWRCDPNEYEDGKSFTGFKGLLQGYLVNEVDMDPAQSCRFECPDFKNATRTGCHNDKCPVQRQCTGRLFNCTYYDADMNVCMTPAMVQQKSSRRYEYIQYKNGTVLGRISKLKPCETVKVESWWRKLPPSHCTYCFCQCEDNIETSERFVSLAPAVSDVKSNKVVTGVRFIKIDRVLYLQIQEGLLGANGQINARSLHWKDVDKKGPKFLMTYEDRKIDLDDIRVPAQRVLTGVRLEEVDGRLGLNVQSAFLNFEAGTVDSNQNQWFTKPKKNRVPLRLKTNDVDMTGGQNTPTPPQKVKDSKSNELQSVYLEFGPSSYETDVGQTTIPLVELQPVVTDPPSLLSGVGLYHKGSSYNAGFLAPRIYTYNYLQHIERT